MSGGEPPDEEAYYYDHARGGYVPYNPRHGYTQMNAVAGPSRPSAVRPMSEPQQQHQQPEMTWEEQQAWMQGQQPQQRSWYEVPVDQRAARQQQPQYFEAYAHDYQQGQSSHDPRHYYPPPAPVYRASSSYSYAVSVGPSAHHAPPPPQDATGSALYGYTQHQQWQGEQLAIIPRGGGYVQSPVSGYQSGASSAGRQSSSHSISNTPHTMASTPHTMDHFPSPVEDLHQQEELFAAHYNRRPSQSFSQHSQHSHHSRTYSHSPPTAELQVAGIPIPEPNSAGPSGSGSSLPRIPLFRGHSSFSDEDEFDGSVTPFISKLLHLLSNEEYSDFICWSTDGRSFVFAHKHDGLLQAFARLFRHSNVQSFVRQLNIYGFTRLATADLLTTLSEITTANSTQQPAQQVTLFHLGKATVRTTDFFDYVHGSSAGRFSGNASEFSGFAHPLFLRAGGREQPSYSLVKPKVTSKKSKKAASGSSSAGLEPSSLGSDEDKVGGKKRRR